MFGNLLLTKNSQNAKKNKYGYKSVIIKFFDTWQFFDKCLVYEVVTSQMIQSIPNFFGITG